MPCFSRWPSGLTTSLHAKPWIDPLCTMSRTSRPKCNDTFTGLRDAFPNLKGVALFDRLPRHPELTPIRSLMWERREIENYVCTRSVLLRYARSTGREASAVELSPETLGQTGLFSSLEADRRERLMNQCIDELESALRQLGRGLPWDADMKVSDDFLTPLFRRLFRQVEPAQSDGQEVLL